MPGRRRRRCRWLRQQLLERALAAGTRHQEVGHRTEHGDREHRQEDPRHGRCAAVDGRGRLGGRRCRLGRRGLAGRRRRGRSRSRRGCRGSGHGERELARDRVPVAGDDLPQHGDRSGCRARRAAGSPPFPRTTGSPSAREVPAASVTWSSVAPGSVASSPLKVSVSCSGSASSVESAAGSLEMSSSCALAGEATSRPPAVRIRAAAAAASVRPREREGVVFVGIRSRLRRGGQCDGRVNSC